MPTTKPDLKKSVYLGNLPFDIDEEMIREALGDPEGKSAKILIAKNAKGLFMGYAFAELTTAEEVAPAVKKLHEQTLGKIMPRKIHAEPGENYPDLLERIP